jgi:NlpC/P60 family putative phage cell wall peptidase
MAGASSTEGANKKWRMANGERPTDHSLLAARHSPTRSAIVAEARNWIGTPYHHQASVKGVGCDCLGLVRGVWRALVGPEPEPIPGYSRDWGEVGARETMLAAARRHLIEIDPQEARAGDVLVFRMRTGRVAKHAGILAGRDCLAATFVHAQEGGPVCEVGLSPWWRRRIAAAFAFPGDPGPAGKDKIESRNEKD